MFWETNLRSTEYSKALKTRAFYCSHRVHPTQCFNSLRKSQHAIVVYRKKIRYLYRLAEYRKFEFLYSLLFLPDAWWIKMFKKWRRHITRRARSACVVNARRRRIDVKSAFHLQFPPPHRPSLFPLFFPSHIPRLLLAHVWYSGPPHASLFQPL